MLDGQMLFQVRVSDSPPPNPGTCRSVSLIKVFPVLSEMGSPAAGQVGHVSEPLWRGAQLAFGAQMRYAKVPGYSERNDQPNIIGLGQSHR
jgi:hypothetical protein